MKYQFNKKYIMKKIEINYYRIKMHTGKKNTEFKDLVRSYVELGNRLKALEEKYTTNDSQNS